MNMNKFWLIAKREYLVRVRRKAFIIATLLAPLGIGVVTIISGYLAAKGGESSKTILVKDDSGIFEKAKKTSQLFTFEFSSDPKDSLIQNYKADGYDILLNIPDFSDPSLTSHQVEYFAEEKLGFTTIAGVESNIGRAFKNYKISVSGIDRDLYDSFEMNVDLENGAKDLEDTKEDSTGKLSIIIGMVMGAIMGFIMYIVIFLYGTMVMRSVMEEKINRIVEVMISSVKPTTLMLGKIFGVGAVGLTQLLIWLLLLFGILTAASFLGLGGDASQLQDLAAQAQEVSANAPKAAPTMDDTGIWEAIEEIKNFNWLVIVPSFIIFFFGGYFIYSALFAAIGSAVGDDMGEAQQLTLPITIPVIMGFVMLQGSIQNPNGTMAIVGSLFPLTSPIIMPSRLAFDPPMWQLLLSIVLLILSCWFFAWVAGRIYRVGILMYGKKITFRELFKWISYKA